MKIRTAALDKRVQNLEGHYAYDTTDGQAPE